MKLLIKKPHTHTIKKKLVFKETICVRWLLYLYYVVTLLYTWQQIPPKLPYKIKIVAIYLNFIYLSIYLNFCYKEKETDNWKLDKIKTKSKKKQYLVIKININHKLFIKASFKKDSKKRGKKYWNMFCKSIRFQKTSYDDNEFFLLFY